MKYIWTALLLLVFYANVLIAGDTGPVAISPERPKLGDTINFAYDVSSKASVLRSAKNIDAYVLVLQDEDFPTLIEIPLEKTGTLWKGSFRLGEGKAKAILVKFVSGQLVDDNGENVWALMVYDENGREVEGAHLSLAQVAYTGNYAGFRRPKDVTVSMQELKTELELYPDNVRAAAFSWSLMMQVHPGEETRGRILGELGAFLSKHGNSDDSVASVVGFYDRLNRKQIADSLRKAWIEKEPRGKMAENKRLNEVGAEYDAAKRAQLLEQFLEDFPQKGEMKHNLERALISAYADARNYDKVSELLARLDPPSSDFNNTIAWKIIERGQQGRDLDSAVAWAKRGIDIIKLGKETKPPYMSNSDWATTEHDGLGLISDTYALGLFKSGKIKEAEVAYGEAVELTDGKQVDIDERYLAACLAIGEYEKVMTLASGFMRNGATSDKLMSIYRTAYVKVKGSEKGFDAVVARAKKTAKESSLKALLKIRINKTAPTFSLRNLNGKKVRLKGLRGKVVVIDFWATWCGPCQASLPYLQEVYNKYKSNPKVSILAINTWENDTTAQRVTIVKDFVAEHKYSFSVLIDEGVVEQYGVEGIPTKFIIDKNGKIQFKSVGFEDGQKMMDELSMQIEVLLGSDFYKKK